MIDPVVELTATLSLALLLASAAVHKASDRRRFVATVQAYELIPDRLAHGFGSLLPMLEAALAVGLLYPPSRSSSAVATVLLLALYTGAIGVNLARGRTDIDCGCFAASSRVPLSAQLILRNTFLAGAAALLFLPVAVRPLVWVDILTIVMAIVTLALLWTSARRLAANGPSFQRSGGPR